MDDILNLPPITKALVITLGAATVLVQCGIFNTSLLILNPNDLGLRAIYQTFTRFLFMPKISISLLFEVILLIQFGKAVEKSSYFPRPSCLIWFLLLLMLSTTTVGIAIPTLFNYFPARDLIFAITVIWSQQNPESPVSIYFLRVTGKYLPLATLILEIAHTASPPFSSLTIGAITYGLLYTRTSSSKLLQSILIPPSWLDNLCSSITVAESRSTFTTGNTPRTWQPFTGTGRRVS